MVNKVWTPPTMDPVKPDGWDPREKPARHCPIHRRRVLVEKTCPVFCGQQYCEECKFADRNPLPEEMQVQGPLEIPDLGEARNWARQHKH